MIKKLKKAFTLVELIVVMAIIAILSTVAVVSYSAIVNKAEQSKVNSELAQIVNVLRAEAGETETVKDGTEELTLSLSEKGELQFDAKLLVVRNETKLNTLFDTLLVGIELDDYTAKLNLDLDDEDLVYTVGTVSSTLDVVINVVTAEVANIDYWIDAAAKQFAGGSGTEIDPYLVTNNRELSLIAKLVNDSETTSQYRTAYYKITKDIDLSGKVWTPIGFDGTDFAGTIYADSKVKISNLSNKNEKALLTNTEDSTKKTRNYGFVGKATGTISISNLQFEDIDAQYVNGYAGGFGGVVGYFDNTTGATNILTIDNVDVLSGTILCTNSQTGGIIGKAYGDQTIVNNCTNAAAVFGSHAAGIIGFASNSNEIIEITGCSNSGNISASAGKAAGILGSATIKQLTIGACLNSGTLLGTSDVAGIATPDRVYDNIVFYDLENSGNITSSSNRAAGISTLLSEKNLFVQKGEDKKETFIKNTGSVNSGNADAAGIFGGNVQVSFFYAYNCKFENSGTISCAFASTVSGTPAQSDMGISALFGYTANATFENCEFINKGNVTSDKANAGLIFAALRNTGSNTGYTFTNCSYKNEGSISGVGANNKQDYDQYFTAKLFGYICYTSKIVEGSSLTVQSE